jgi:hypothetical protein
VKSVETRVASLELLDEARAAAISALAARVRTLEKMLDTKATPLWKRVWFRIDGWPAWYHVAARREWRPWHRGD